MPTFCRHNRFADRCPICIREREERENPGGAAAARPRRVVGGPGVTASARRAGSGRRSPGLQVRQAKRPAADGFASPLVPGLRSSVDAQRLAEEIGFSTARIAQLAAEPPGFYAEIAATADLEQALAMAFLISYLAPTEGDDPFAGVRAVAPIWVAGGTPALVDVPLGPRSAHDPARGERTLIAYRAWAERAGSQAAAFEGDAGWTPRRRYERIFERLALPGLHRAARFELLLVLARLELVPLQISSLMLGGGDDVELAAKRVFGIGDLTLLERRAADLAAASDVPLEALELALFNWEGGERRATLGASGVVVDDDASVRVCEALGVPVGAEA